MTMYKEYTAVLHALCDYACDYAESGYSAGAAENIVKMLRELPDTPLAGVYRTFGFGDLECCAAALGLLAATDGRTAAKLSALSGKSPGIVTPGLVCGMFTGTSDILAAARYFAADSLLGRIFDDVRPAYDAEMSLKDYITVFMLTGELDDDAFLPPAAYDTRFTKLAENTRAEADIVAALRAVNENMPRVICVHGEKGVGRRTAVERASAAAKIPTVFLGLNSGVKLRELTTKLFLLDAHPVVCEDESFISEAELLAAVRLLVRETGLVTLISERSHSAAEFGAETVNIAIGGPDMREQFTLWQSECAAYKLVKGTDISELPGEFDMNAGGIAKAMRCAAMYSTGGALTINDIKAGCVRSVDADMGSKATKINCVFGWDDIVLPEHSKRMLKAACDQVRYRHTVYDDWGFSGKLPYGKSVSMIFTGPPGTGKTMGAQVIAAELGLDIYRISLANVVSKYIGETEKNLDEIFDKAKKSKVVLFFDEADVLFSKRTEVKDSNDKYSNMESAFLLQKIEEYSGIVILATNLVQNFDEAFKRRMKLIIDFPFPDAARRREMWKRAFPDSLPLGDIDFDYLVERFELSGSNIKNIALHSAFLAAADGSRAVEMRHIIAALKNEYGKSGKAFTKADAGEYFPLLGE